ncbi:uncharacterized protein BCR38DRAFT_351835 [Pseudomassariella vexata]|uniref:FAD-binding domain-containing protein n=1 Tax=Pseudomassariella vexata TaxID=1141098 RepID=A0A1Y2DJ48_9PEZI|nr:uncharacterized protein BCR38DRAFT_351835 [Pseudomassariella vexata]ORY59268.1 hypothetical protein BCR38DRAFT_351835 [Pseudomassariella vexata]
MSDSPKSGFKVIIAGGSVSGLTLANALERAGIDFVLLEKRDIATDVGQSLFVLPCTSLVHEQLGVGKATREVGFPILLREHWDGTGSLFCSSDELLQLYQRAKRPALFVDRHTFFTSLYDGLEDKSEARIRTREGVASFTESDHGVTVITDKGNVIEGSILVGADGVHSGVRTHMAELLQDKNPSASKALARGFKARYYVLAGTSYNHFPGNPEVAFLADGKGSNVYDEKEQVGGLTVAGVPGKVFWFIYVPMETPSEYPCRKFTQTDIDAVMTKYGHLRATGNCTFKDMFANLDKCVMVPMEEGIIKTSWNSGGRTVLVGDSVHKATSNLGMGGNLCVDDICGLVNGLVPLLERNPSPSTKELVQVFDQYEKQARPRAHFVRISSSIFADFECMSGWWTKMMKRVFPWIPASVKMRVFSWFDGSAPKLNFLPVKTGEDVAKYRD